MSIEEITLVKKFLEIEQTCVSNSNKLQDFLLNFENIVKNKNFNDVQTWLDMGIESCKEEFIQLSDKLIYNLANYERITEKALCRKREIRDHYSRIANRNERILKKFDELINDSDSHLKNIRERIEFVNDCKFEALYGNKNPSVEEILRVEGMN